MKEIREMTCNFNLLKDRLFIRTVGFERNREMLARVPHVVVEDMAIIYGVIVENCEKNISSFLITNDILNMYGVSLQQLHNAAMINAPIIMEAKFCSMGEALWETFNDGAGDSDDETALMMKQVFCGSDCDGPEMYILTNKKKIFGAASMFYPGVMRQIADQIGRNFYILPSSCHEVIIVKLPENSGMTIEDLYVMVSSVNADRSVMDEKDILTNSVYRYNVEQDRIEIVCNNMMERKAV